MVEAVSGDSKSKFKPADTTLRSLLRLRTALLQPSAWPSKPVCDAASALPSSQPSTLPRPASSTAACGYPNDLKQRSRLVRLLQHHALLHSQLMSMQQSLLEGERRYQQAVANKDEVAGQVMVLQERLSDEQQQRLLLDQQKTTLERERDAVLTELATCRAELCSSQTQLTETLTQLQEDMKAALKRKDEQLHQTQSQLEAQQTELTKLRDRCAAHSEHEQQERQRRESLTVQFQQLGRELHEEQCRRQDQERMLDDLKSQLITALNEGVEAEKQLTQSARLQTELLASKEQLRVKDSEIREWVRRMDKVTERKLALESQLASVQQSASTRIPVTQKDKVVQVQFDTMKVDILKVQLKAKSEEVEVLKRDLDQLHRLVDHLKDQLSAKDADKELAMNKLSLEVARLSDELERATNRNGELDRRIHATQQHVLERDEEIHQLRVQLHALRETVRQMEPVAGPTATQPVREVAKPTETQKETIWAEVDLTNPILEGLASFSNLVPVAPGQAALAADFLDLSTTRDRRSPGRPSAESFHQSTGKQEIRMDETLNRVDGRIRALEDVLKQTLDRMQPPQPSKALPENNTKLTQTEEDLLANSLPSSSDIVKGHRLETWVPEPDRPDETVRLLDDRIQALQRALHQSIPDPKKKMHQESADDSDQLTPRTLQHTQLYMADIVRALDDE